MGNVKAKGWSADQPSTQAFTLQFSLKNLERKEQIHVKPFGNEEISKLITFYYEKNIQNVKETVPLGHRQAILYLL